MKKIALILLNCLFLFLGVFVTLLSTTNYKITRMVSLLLLIVAFFVLYKIKGRKRTLFIINMLFASIIVYYAVLTFFIYSDIEPSKSLKEIEQSYIDANIDKAIEKATITEETSTQLMFYFTKVGDKKKKQFWNQSCLFFRNSYCINYTDTYAIKKEHESIRKEYFLEGKDDLHLLVEGDKNTAENRCYVVFYKAQNDLDKNKREFLNNYPICKEYYIQNIPALVEYENSFLQIMAF